MASLLFLSLLGARGEALTLIDENQRFVMDQGRISLFVGFAVLFQLDQNIGRPDTLDLPDTSGNFAVDVEFKNTGFIEIRGGLKFRIFKVLALSYIAAFRTSIDYYEKAVYANFVQEKSMDFNYLMQYLMPELLFQLKNPRWKIKVGAGINLGKPKLVVENFWDFRGTGVFWDEVLEYAYNWGLGVSAYIGGEFWIKEFLYLTPIIGFDWTRHHLKQATWEASTFIGDFPRQEIIASGKIVKLDLYTINIQVMISLAFWSGPKGR